MISLASDSHDSISNDKPTKCAVCGKSTSYRHYSLPCCFGCRSFFRRCVVNKSDYKCKRNGMCNVNYLRRCKGCRQKKCNEVGLNPDWIHYEKNREEETCEEQTTIVPLSKVSFLHNSFFKLFFYFRKNFNLFNKTTLQHF